MAIYLSSKLKLRTVFAPSPFPVFLPSNLGSNIRSTRSFSTLVRSWEWRDISPFLVKYLFFGKTNCRETNKACFVGQNASLRYSSASRMSGSCNWVRILSPQARHSLVRVNERL